MRTSICRIRLHLRVRLSPPLVLVDQNDVLVDQNDVLVDQNDVLADQNGTLFDQQPPRGAKSGDSS